MTAGQVAIDLAVPGKAAAAASKASGATGKHVIIIWKVWVSPEGDNYGWFWGSTQPGAVVDPNNHKPSVPSQEQAVALVQAWIAKQSDPASWELLVTK